MNETINFTEIVRHSIEQNYTLGNQVNFIDIVRNFCDITNSIIDDALIRHTKFILIYAILSIIERFYNPHIKFNRIIEIHNKYKYFYKKKELFFFTFYLDKIYINLIDYDIYLITYIKSFLMAFIFASLFNTAFIIFVQIQGHTVLEFIKKK